VLTSSQQTVDIERAYALGVNAYVVKPNTFDGLVELVKSIQAYWTILNKRPEDPDIRPSPPGWGGFK
jgi:DNA-binding NarL/FixJ family response regulator